MPPQFGGLRVRRRGLRPAPVEENSERSPRSRAASTTTKSRRQDRRSCSGHAPAPGGQNPRIRREVAPDACFDGLKLMRRREARSDRAPHPEGLLTHHANDPRMISTRSIPILRHQRQRAYSCTKVWCRRQSRTRLSRSVAPPSTQCSMWCASRNLVWVQLGNAHQRWSRISSARRIPVGTERVLRPVRTTRPPHPRRPRPPPRRRRAFATSPRRRRRSRHSR